MDNLADALVSNSVAYVLVCQTLEELAAADQGRRSYLRLKAQEEKSAAAQIVPEKVNTDPEKAEMVFRALTWGPLGVPYTKLLELLMSVPSGQFRGAEEIAIKLGTGVQSVQAQLSKLSGRLKRVADPSALPKPPTSPLALMFDIAYAPNGTTYALLPAAREAVRRYLSAA